MEKDYSNEVKGLEYAYRFSRNEKELISAALKVHIKKLEKKIESIDRNPRNEGQVTYLEEKKYIRYDVKALEEIIKSFQV